MDQGTVYKVLKTDNSLVVTLPAEALALLALEEGSEVIITLDPLGKRLIIQQAHSPLATGQPALAAQLDTFIEAYRPALEALAR